MKIMTKHLTELDTVYADVFKNMTMAERVEYCKSLIKTTQNFLSKNDEILLDSIKVKSYEIIASAEEEINRILKTEKK